MTVSRELIQQAADNAWDVDTVAEHADWHPAPPSEIDRQLLFEMRADIAFYYGTTLNL